MYTYHNFVFGHDLSLNEELKNEVLEFGFEMSEEINGRRFEISAPYHGGRGKPIIVGVIITDDDVTNKNYINEVRSAKEEDYLNDYNTFVESVKKNLIADMGVDDGEDYDKFTDQLIDFLDNNKPIFYNVEVTS